MAKSTLSGIQTCTIYPVQLKAISSMSNVLCQALASGHYINTGPE